MAGLLTSSSLPREGTCTSQELRVTVFRVSVSTYAPYGPHRCPAPATWVHRGATVWEDEEDLIDFTAFHLLYARADLSGHHLPG